MARYYRRRSPMLWIVGFLVSIIAVTFIARVVYQWLLPLIPLVGAILLVIALTYTGFRRHR